MIESPRVTATLAAALIAVALPGCTAKNADKAETPGGTSAQITVDATDSACRLSADQVGTGKRTFSITNNGTKVTEFYIYGKDNGVLAEAENISPGLQRTLDVEFAEPGTYKTVCKPGMVGDGIGAEVTVHR